MVAIKAVVIGVGPNKFDGKQVHLFADIVLVDRSKNIQPILYELNFDGQNIEAANAPSFFSLPKGHFIFMGEVEGIDKKKKIIHLVGGGTVSYNHLISAKGMKSLASHEAQENEFASIAFKHLAGAVKIQKKVVEPVVGAIDPFLQPPKYISHSLTHEVNHSQGIAKIAQITIPTQNDPTRNLQTYERSLEFQI